MLRVGRLDGYGGWPVDEVPEPGAELPRPRVAPDQRGLAEVVPAGSYRQGEAVWVWRDGGWQPGVVDAASELAVLVTYWPDRQRGGLVDTVTARYLAVRIAARPEPDGGSLP